MADLKGNPKFLLAASWLVGKGRRVRTALFADHVPDRKSGVIWMEIAGSGATEPHSNLAADHLTVPPRPQVGPKKGLAYYSLAATFSGTIVGTCSGFTSIVFAAEASVGASGLPAI